jgi:hypothetical protein
MAAWLGPMVSRDLEDTRWEDGDWRESKAGRVVPPHRRCVLFESAAAASSSWDG